MIKKIISVFLAFILSLTIVYAESIDFSVTSAKVLEKSGTMEAVDPSFSSNNVNSNSIFKNKNDYVVYSITLKNNESEEYKLIDIEDNNTNEYVDVTYESDKDVIAANDTVTINVKIQYSTLVKNVERQDLNDFDVILVLENENGDTSEIIINPKTSDNIIYYIILLAISIVGLVLLIKKYKVGIALLILPIVISPLMIFSKQDYKVNIRFRHMIVMGEFDVFEVEIDSGNGTTETRNIKYGDTVGTLDTPSKDGYDFVGWVDENGDPVSSDTVITTETSIRAKYNIINYTITYNLDDGSATNVETYTIEDEITLNNPTKAGYSFSGWTEGDDTTLRTSLTINRGSMGNKTFTAHFSANPDTVYHVIHMKMDMNGVYEEALNEELHGTTDSEVTPQVKQYEGFIIPAEQTIKIDGSGETSLTYYYERKKFNFAVNNKDYVTCDTEDGEYYYGKEIHLTAKSKLGYTFSKWSNNETTSDLTITLSDNLTIEPIYTPNTNTPYKVIHKIMKMDGVTYETHSELNESGTTDSEVTPPTLTLTGFKSPETQTVTISAEGNTKVEYLYEREKYQLTINNKEFVETEFDDGKYFYGTQITATAKSRVGYTFDGWLSGETSQTLSFSLSSDTVVEPVYTIINYTVKFDSMGGSDVPDIVTTYNQPLGALTIPELENHNFMGWYTSDGNTKISSSTLVTEDITYYAHWVKIICKKAPSLHQETCYHDSGTSGNTGCHNAGIAQNTTLEYGTLPGENSPFVGDAYDCDINNDGVYNSTNERFYFIREIGDGDNATAALVLYNNVDQYGNLSDAEIYAYDDSLEYLPDSSLWTNPGLIEIDGKVSRLINQDDVVAACGTWSLDEGYIDACTFFLENSRYQSNTLGRSAIWIEKVGNKNYRIDTRSRRITTGDNSGIRPVIEIPYNTIDGYIDGPKYTISFDSQGGPEVEDIIRHENQKLGNLPNPNWTGYIFDGWFTDTNYSEQIDGDVVVLGDETYYAKWTPKITQATITPASLVMNLEINETAQLIVTPVEGMEEYTITSNKPNVAEYDETTNTVLGKTTGSAVISIVGSRSHEQIDIAVTVGHTYTVTFENDGNPYDTREIAQDETLLGNMPSDPVKSGYIFVGWFIDGDINYQFDDNTVVTGDLTVIAVWADENSVARIGNVYFDNLFDALAAAPTTGEETTVVILRDFTVPNNQRPTVNAGANVIIDAGNHTLTCGNKNIVYNNNGTVTIMNGKYTCGATGQSTLENNTSGKMYITGGIIEQTKTDNTTSSNGRSAIYNGGQLYISGDAYLSSVARDRATVHNYNGNSKLYMSGGTVEQKNANCTRGAIQNQVSSAKMYITGGTVISYSTVSTSGGIQNVTGGTVVIGTAGDDKHDKTTPVIRGNVMAVNSETGYSFYDGILEAVTSVTNVGLNDITHETGTTAVENETVTIDSTTYKTLYYVFPDSGKYRINLNTNGGEISESYKEFNLNATVTADQIPSPNKGIYTFDGWYEDENTTTSPVSFPISIPGTAGETTYYAKWSYNASNEIVNFDMTNEAMTEYYNSINAWKSDTSTFQTNMDNNFNNYNCSECTGPDYQNCPTPSAGTTLCDQPLGYDTGMNASVKVYTSSETNKEKGSLVSYTTSSDGVIYNMIPGEVYYWELESDSNVYGLVKADGNRRPIYSSVRNVRDLGGLSATYTDDEGTHSGTLEYGILYRGSRIVTADDVNSLNKLGINEELDLRESNSDKRVGSIYKDIEIINYRFDRSASERAAFRNAITTAMEDVVAGNSIYFHCKVGTDRTGTLAYFLEGLLGVNEEDKLEDYELSYFYGLLNRTRFHDNLSSSTINPRFATMATTYDTNEKIYNWYIDDPDNQASDIALVKQFRQAMIH